MYRYEAFGMEIVSEITLALPDFCRSGSPKARTLGSSDRDFFFGDAGRESGQAVSGRVTILQGKVPPESGLPYTLGRVRYGGGPTWMQVEVPWAGRYRIDFPSRILVQPEPGAEDRIVGLYITGFVLPLLLNRSGVLLLHGSACGDGKSAFVLCGRQGAGKSTTAAALAERGYPILCDDVVPVTTGPSVLPGITYAKLLPDAYSRMVGDPKEAEHLFDGVDKYRVTVAASHQPLPLSAIYILESVGKAEPSVTALLGMEKIRSLLPHAPTLEGDRGAAKSFQSLLELLGKTRVYRLSRPEGRDTLERVAELIETLRKEDME